MIFQNPRTALNPIRQVGQQIADVLVRHGGATRTDAPRAAVEMLKRVRIPDPERRAEAYPFELSGGMCQRVMIAIALACRPALLIADEPTTGLDVTTQAVIMDLIGELARDAGMATIFITHDLALAAEYCDRIVVMHAGHVVEAAPARALFAASAPSLFGQAAGRDAGRDGRRSTSSPRSRAACPTCAAPTCRPAASATAASGASTTAASRCRTARARRAPRRVAAGTRYDAPLLDSRRARQALRRRQGKRLLHAVDEVDLHHRPRRDRRPGGRIGLRQVHAGAPDQPAARSDRRAASGSPAPSIADMRARAFAGNANRARIQMVFQDAGDSLNPRYTAADAIADPLPPPEEDVRRGAHEPASRRWPT